MIRQKAFTLIELMIAVAIVGVLAAVAYPTYQNSVQKSRRADAQAALVELAAFMERIYTENNSYNVDLDGDGTSIGSDEADEFPFTTSPRSGGAFYNLSLSAVGATTFTLQAVPVTGSSQADDACKTMTLNQAGAKTTTGTAGCW